MSAFLIELRSDHAQSVSYLATHARSLDALRKKGLTSTRPPRTIEGARLHLFGSPTHDPGNVEVSTRTTPFATYVGTLIYRGRTGKEAMQALVHDLDAEGDSALSRVHGNYCLLLHRGGVLRALTDSAGLYHVYHTEDLKTVSSSFVSAALARRTRVLDHQAMYEYLLLGACFGAETYIAGVLLMGSDEEFHVRNGICSKVSRQSPYKRAVEDYASYTINDFLNHALEAGRNYYHEVCQAFGQRVTGALTGGFDTRLSLAFAGSQGIVPRLYVYGSDNSEDVRVAKHICSRLKLELEVIDYESRPKLDPEAYWENQEGVFHCLDAMTSYGALCDPTEIARRAARMAGGWLAVNGGAGEIWRNFWNLPDRTRTTSVQLVRSFYDRVPSGSVASCFRPKPFWQNLARKLEDALECGSQGLSRADVESAYPRFRVRFWQGKNNSVNNTLGYAVSPFAECSFTVASTQIPIKYKELGWFERQMLITLSPALAGEMSNYGFDFLRGPGLKSRVSSWLVQRVPISLRPVLRKAVKSGSRGFPYYSREAYIQRRFGKLTDLNIRQYANLEAIGDPLMLSRAMTLERVLRDEW